MSVVNFAIFLNKKVSAFSQAYLMSRLGKYSNWPFPTKARAEPGPLYQLYTYSIRDIWNSQAVFADILSRTPRVEASPEQRQALGRLVQVLMWGELFAWNMSAQLTNTVDDVELKMALSSQLYDEARHFFIFGEYLKSIDFKPNEIDPFFLVALRQLLSEKDVYFKMLALQVLVEGTAMAFFTLLSELNPDPVLTELLVYVSNDESRHIGIATNYLAQEIQKISPRKMLKLRSKMERLLQLTGQMIRGLEPDLKKIGADPGDLLKRMDRNKASLTRKWGKIPGKNFGIIPFDDPNSENYDQKIKLCFPENNSQDLYLKIHDYLVKGLEKIVR